MSKVEILHNILHKQKAAPLVIGHDIGGIDIPAKMVRLAKSLSQE
jgi:hypothetical protein